jgi:hypothetical protein
MDYKRSNQMKMIATVFMLMLAILARSQGVISFFNQQDTKKKRMAEQVVLLETYLAEVKKGYTDTKNGLKTIHDLKNGAMDLNKGYISSLSAISPAISGNPKIAQIKRYGAEIQALWSSEIAYQPKSSVLTASEMNYVIEVDRHLKYELTNDLEQLDDLIMPGKLQMTDNERIAAIDGIYSSVKDKYAFSVDFTSKLHQMALGRLEERRSRNVLKELYKIK